MRLAFLFIALFCFTLTGLHAEQAAPQKQTTKRFESFTGKITGNNVRMRLAPNLDAQVFKELERDDLVLVTGLVDDFYACAPPKNLKGYIFRTYVLDGVVEGTNVFVRLGPDRTSPAVAQLSSGDVVKGTIAAQNNKWLQIDLPEEVRFYIAKDFVKQVGDAAYFSQQEARRLQAHQTLAEIEHQLDQELQKPFTKIQLSKIATALTQFAIDNKDMPQAVSQAESLISRMQEEYLTKSVAYSDAPPVVDEVKHLPLPGKKPSEPIPEKLQPNTPPPQPAKPLSTVSWIDREEGIVQAAIDNGKAADVQQFYLLEMNDADTLHGIIKPYNSFLTTRPGDFVLLNLKTNLPIAYLYSTKVDLTANVNKPVTVWVTARPNNNFAFPAFFVLQVEE